jgi:hypothetical protein
VSNLIKLNTQPTDQYDWNLIEDHNNRSVAKSTVSNYVTQWSALRTQADKLIETNTLALSKCVYTLKETLPHGEFTSVCQQALKLNHDKQGALAAVGRALMNGDVPEEALKLLNQMEPSAARKYLNSPEEVKTQTRLNFEQTGRVPTKRDFQAPKTDEETKHRFVANFENSGKVPSRRDFQAPKTDEVAKKDYVVHFEETGRVPSQRDFQTPPVEVTQSKWEAKDRFTAYKIRPVHALEALVDMLSSQKELRPDVETALISLAKEADRLLALRAK